MPIHDWSRVDAGVFHDFHQRWIVEISASLNDGILPAEFYALAGQVTGGPIPDIVTLERREAGMLARTASGGPDSNGEESTAVTVADHPPRVQYTHVPEEDPYAARATRVAIHHVSGDEVVGYIEIVSPGNKHSEAAIRQFCDKLSDAIRGGCHVLVIDLHGPTPRDPRGIHARFWQDQFGRDGSRSEFRTPAEPGCLP